MKICKVISLFLCAMTVLVCSQANAFFGKNRALPSAMYFSNYGNPYFGTTAPFAGYEADTVFIAPTRGYSPFNYRYWNRQAVAAPIVEYGYAEGVVNGCYNAEYDPNCCGNEMMNVYPVAYSVPVVDSYFPAPQSFQPVRNTLRALKSLFCHEKPAAYFDPCFPCYDPCFPCCDPCFPCCDPCFPCCDPCFTFCDPCCGSFVTGSPEPCCGVNDIDNSSIIDNSNNNGIDTLNTQPNSSAPSSAVPTSDPSTTLPNIPASPIPASPIVDPNQILQPQTNNQGVIRMIVPADSIVYINGYQTKLTGTERNFTANDLVPGQTYSFEVRVVAERNGQAVEAVKTASLVAGSTSSLAFSDFDTQGLQEIALR